MNNYIKYFNEEWDRLKKYFEGKDDLEVYEDFRDLIKEILRVWGRQGHSGFSANFFAPKVCKIIENAMLFKPFVPIQNEEDFDFYNTGNGTLQSKRLSSVFKDNENAPAHYLYAIVWNDGDSLFTGTLRIKGLGEINSSANIKKYPFTPKSFYVDVRLANTEKPEYLLTLKGKLTLVEALEYYDVVILDDGKEMENV